MGTDRDSNNLPQTSGCFLDSSKVRGLRTVINAVFNTFRSGLDGHCRIIFEVNFSSPVTSWYVSGGIEVVEISERMCLYWPGPIDIC